MTRDASREPWTRRELLKALGSTSLLSAAGGRITLAAAASESTVYDCIVLGAGIAGVTAARDLAQAGKRVLLVEGADRVGGRIHTRRDFVSHPRFAGDPGRYPLEVGAEYIHVGTKRYAAFLDEVRALGFGRKNLDKFSRGRLAFPSWKKNPKTFIHGLLRDPELVKTVTLLSSIDGFRGRDGADLSAGEYVARRKKRKDYSRRAYRMARYSIGAHTPGVLYSEELDTVSRGGEIACRLAADEDTLSVRGMKADRLPHQLVGETAEFRIKRNGAHCGYDALPDAILDQLLDSADDGSGRVPGELILGQRVTRVVRDGNGVVVHSEDTAGRPRSFRGRSALCTFSVGMLAARGGAIFGELLTEGKRGALDSVRMGPITKISLEFKKSHWGRKAKMALLVNPAGCARTFFAPYPKKKGPYILTALLMGRDHQLIQDLDDDEAVQHLLDDLHSILERRKRKRPRWRPEDVLVGHGSGVDFEPNYSRRDWARDPFALGGNSFISYRGLSIEDVDGLREALRDPTQTLPLFWAGEATAPAYNVKYQPLSVHGAYISGVGAADDIRHYLESDAGTFRASYQEARGAPEAALPAGPRFPTLRLTEEEHAALEAWANAAEGGDLAAAARELVRLGLYIRLYREKSLEPRPKTTTFEIPLELGADERTLLKQQADELFAGDLDLTARAIYRRGWKARSGG